MKALAALILALAFAAPAASTPLHHAAMAGDTDAIAAQLGAGADPDAQNAAGRTALHEAALGGHTEAIITLLDAGADPNAKDIDGTTPLHAAARHCHTKATIALLDGGANPDVQDGMGRTPSRMAYDRCHTTAQDELARARARLAEAEARLAEAEASLARTRASGEPESDFVAGLAKAQAGLAKALARLTKAEARARTEAEARQAEARARAEDETRKAEARADAADKARAKAETRADAEARARAKAEDETRKAEARADAADEARARAEARADAADKARDEAERRAARLAEGEMVLLDCEAAPSSFGAIGWYYCENDEAKLYTVLPLTLFAARTGEHFRVIPQGVDISCVPSWPEVSAGPVLVVTWAVSNILLPTGRIKVSVQVRAAPGARFRRAQFEGEATINSAYAIKMHETVVIDQRSVAQILGMLHSGYDVQWSYSNAHESARQGILTLPEVVPKLLRNCAESGAVRNLAEAMEAHFGSPVSIEDVIRILVREARKSHW